MIKAFAHAAEVAEAANKHAADVRKKLTALKADHARMPIYWDQLDEMKTDVASAEAFAKKANAKKQELETELIKAVNNDSR